MSSSSEGWSVHLDGTGIVIRVPGLSKDHFAITIEEARTLRNRLHVAFLVARRSLFNISHGVEEADSSSEDTAEQSDALPAPVEADELPEGWHIGASGQLVALVVPASAADGEFKLSVEEALAAGDALIEQAGLASAARMQAIRGSFERLNDVFDLDYLGDKRGGWRE